jgi:hypothetical protein
MKHTCPNGHKFGEDCDKFVDCETCDLDTILECGLAAPTIDKDELRSLVDLNDKLLF